MRFQIKLMGDVFRANGFYVSRNYRGRISRNMADGKDRVIELLTLDLRLKGVELEVTCEIGEKGSIPFKIKGGKVKSMDWCVKDTWDGVVKLIGYIEEYAQQCVEKTSYTKTVDEANVGDILDDSVVLKRKAAPRRLPPIQNERVGSMLTRLEALLDGNSELGSAESNILRGIVMDLKPFVSSV